MSSQVVVTEQEENKPLPDPLIQQAQEYGEMRAEFRQLQQQLAEALSMLQTAQQNNVSEARLIALENKIETLQQQKQEIQAELEAIEENPADQDVTIIEPPPLPEPPQPEPEPEPKRHKFWDYLLS